MGSAQTEAFLHINHPAQLRSGKAFHAEQQSLYKPWFCALLLKGFRETSSAGP